MIVLCQHLLFTHHFLTINSYTLNMFSLFRSSPSLHPSMTMRRYAYSKALIDRFESPKRIGSFPKDDSDVGTGLVGAPACGDVMKLQIKVNENGVITQSRFKTFGCGSAVASSDVAAEWVENQHIDDVITIKNTDIAQYLKLPPVKLHCSMLAEDAIKAAVKDYKHKQALHLKKGSSPVIDTVV